jgi:FtsZ-binding cell division protein ZapB
MEVLIPSVICVLDKSFDDIRKRILNHSFDNILEQSFNLPPPLEIDLALSLGMSFSRQAIEHILQHSLSFINNEMKDKLQELKQQIADSSKTELEAPRQCLQENDQVWNEQLRTVMIEHRNIGHDWQFSDAQGELLRQYYHANKLLVDCLNSDCYVSREVI